MILSSLMELIGQSFTYQTDTDRNITKVFGIVELKDAQRIPSAQKAIVEQTGRPGEDHGGQLIAKIFNGSGDIDNLVAMDRLVNQSEYRRVENAKKKLLKKVMQCQLKQMLLEMVVNVHLNLLFLIV